LISQFENRVLAEAGTDRQWRQLPYRSLGQPIAIPEETEGNPDWLACSSFHRQHPEQPPPTTPMNKSPGIAE